MLSALLSNLSYVTHLREHRMDGRAFQFKWGEKQMTWVWLARYKEGLNLRSSSPSLMSLNWAIEVIVFVASIALIFSMHVTNSYKKHATLLFVFFPIFLPLFIWVRLRACSIRAGFWVLVPNTFIALEPGSFTVALLYIEILLRREASKFCFNTNWKNNSFQAEV